MKHVQRRLGMEDDGKFDLRVESKVRGYQTLHHLHALGVVDRDTAKHMG